MESYGNVFLSQLYVYSVSGFSEEIDEKKGRLNAERQHRPCGESVYASVYPAMPLHDAPVERFTAGLIFLRLPMIRRSVLFMQTLPVRLTIPVKKQQSSRTPDEIAMKDD